jgi:phospholipid-binding lipoprotein MlaA
VIRSGFVLAAAMLCSACSTLEGDEYGVFDTRERANRTSYNVTDAIDRKVLLPVAKGYDKVTPSWLQRGVLNVFLNLRTIGSSVNGFLQGKPAAGSTDFARVLINSTIGIAGFFDVASKWDLTYQDEDFGQTLAVWGVKRSRYVYVPFLGPSTLRDLPSAIVRSAMPRLILGSEYHWGMSVVDIVSARADLISATKVRDASALDPYAFTRDAYYQRRKFLIFDGDPPVEDFFDEFDEFDE